MSGKIQLSDEVAAEIIEAHFRPVKASIDLLRDKFVATVGEGVWEFPEPTVRVNQVLSVSPIDWEHDELAVPKLFYLLYNRTDKEKLGRFTKGEDTMTFVWPPDDELMELEINGKPFANFTESDIKDVCIGWALSLDAQQKAHITDLIEHKYNIRAPDVAETVWAFCEALGLTPDEVLNLTNAQLLTMVAGSEAAAKRMRERFKKKH